MAITREQALVGREFHYLPACKVTIGPRGGIVHKNEVWRRNGQTQTWATRPDQFRIPVKFGLRGYASITEADAEQFVLASECPICTLVGKHYNDPETLRQKLGELTHA